MGQRAENPHIVEEGVEPLPDQQKLYRELERLKADNEKLRRELEELTREYAAAVDRDFGGRTDPEPSRNDELVQEARELLRETKH